MEPEQKRKVSKWLGTEFAFDDIAFLDQDPNMLFYTTPHEGDANIEKGLLE